MSPVNHGRLRAIASFSLCLAVWLSHCLALAALPQADEQTAIHRIALAYFAAYQKKDVEGVMSLWSEKSPEAAANRQSLQQTFAGTEKIVLKIVKLGKAIVEADKAKIRIDVEINAVESKTGQPAHGFGYLHRTLELVKEGGEWKVWRSFASEEELAAALVAAGTEQERMKLLAAENELVTVGLQQALVNRGQRLFSQGNYRQALTISQLALQIAEQLGDRRGMTVALRNIGNIHFGQGDYAQASEYFQKSLKLAEEQKDKTGIARALGSLGSIPYLQGDYAQALEYFQKSLKLAQEAGDKAGMISVIGNMGGIYLAQGNYTRALDNVQQTLKFAEEMKDKVGIARALISIGVVYKNQGNYAEALEYYQKGLKLTEEIGAKALIAFTLVDIGTLHSAQGNYAQALEYLQKSLKFSEEIGDKVRIAGALNNIGIAHYSQGNYTQALEYYRQSLRLTEELGDKARIAGALNNIGIVYKFQGNYAEALEYYEKSLKLAEEMEDKAAIASTLNNISIVYAEQGNYTRAVELANRAASLFAHSGHLEVLWEPFTIAGKAYRALNQPEPARRSFVEAISTIEKLRDQVAGGEQEQQRFFENKLAPYSQMANLLIAQQKPAEALAYAERAKGRVLLDVLRKGRANITRAMTRDEREQELKLNSELIALNSRLSQQKLQRNPDEAQIADLNARLEKARLAYESFQTGLYAAHPELRVQRGETPPLTLSEAARLLPADGNTALLEYLVDDDNSFLFVLTKAAPTRKQNSAAITLKVYPLNVKSKELRELVETFQKRLGERNLAFNALAQRLYGLLLKPAEGQLRGKDMLCIVPDGMLWQLPFQALKPTARRYLIEDRAIFYAPSLSTLREMIKTGKRTVDERVAFTTPVLAGVQTGANPLPRLSPRARSSLTLLAFGNPLLNPRTVARQQAIYRDDELGALPEAEKEVEALRDLYGAARSRVYTGAAAREERVKSEIGNYRVVHFATHGILDDRSPLYSHLLLAQEPGNSVEDGLLEAREIMEMDLQAELVVLSACQTAGGRVGAGEGVIGMTWALFVAGCPTTLVSQWKVDTRSTSRLMIEFHGNLHRQHQRSAVTSKAEALRQAMLTLLRSEEYELPYYWAPFVLVGDGF
jgi:CHAT domain-containing protein/tetratricopeptide (TPR) repeat protein